MNNKNAYVLISINGVVEYWPYPEVQEFFTYDLSKYVIYLEVV